MCPETCVTVHLFFFFNDTATTEIYTLSLHDALPIWWRRQDESQHRGTNRGQDRRGGFWVGEGCFERSGVGGEGAADYRRSDGDGGSREDLSREGDAAGGFRRVRGNHSRHRRVAAHQRSGGASHWRHPRRVEGRRSGAGESAGGGREPHPAVA